MAWRENEDEVNPQTGKDGERHREKDGQRPRLPQSEPRTHQRLETNGSIHIKKNNSHRTVPSYAGTTENQ